MQQVTECDALILESVSKAVLAWRWGGCTVAPSERRLNHGKNIHQGFQIAGRDSQVQGARPNGRTQVRRCGDDRPRGVRARLEVVERREAHRWNAELSGRAYRLL